MLRWAGVRVDVRAAHTDVRRRCAAEDDADADGADDGDAGGRGRECSCSRRAPYRYASALRA